MDEEMKCPKCGNTDGIYTTCMGFLNVGKSCKDTNHASCPCGHKGEAWEFGAPDIPPMKGTENWTDEKIDQWHKDFDNGNIKIRTNPGMKGIQLTEYDDAPISSGQADSTIILGK